MSKSGLCLGETNSEALREVFPSMSFGCFIKKPITIVHLIERVMAKWNNVTDNDNLSLIVELSLISG